MPTLTLKTKTGSCRILLNGSLQDLPALIAQARAVVVTDQNVFDLYGSGLSGYEVVTLLAGEEQKTLATVEKLYGRFCDLELARSSFVVGVGGGVICDLVGFAASTYLRGLPFGFVPTTLLAQVDAAIGGKNGVNLKGYKNLVGAFQQPRFVLQDVAFLQTLSKSEFVNGLAETIKQAAVGDAALFAYLEEHLEAVLDLDQAVLAEAIAAAAKVKIGIVERDETEQGERRILNFGHTFGHALEKASGLPHGRAVSLGMVLAADLSCRRGLLAEAEAERLRALLVRAGLPVREELDMLKLVDAIRRDKKRDGANVNFVLLEQIGRAAVQEIAVDELTAAFTR